MRTLLQDQADRWLGELPGHVKRLLDDWRLTIADPDQPPMHGLCAIVLPVTTADGDKAVLKVGITGPDNHPEAEALRRWGGQGAVRLLRAAPHHRRHPRRRSSWPVASGTARMRCSWSGWTAPGRWQVSTMSSARQ
ncbi:protein kinase family protein [Fodinicola feengrottensis]|uniref:aminoglycoside phosphotransferase family protein n=1 Tax=Fodinicola feengrottensis TaxID=435914 RepID=UPI002442CEAF|nr:aminoglycoside phosphotransferase family protein [Fodinicola feengrottensis]